MAKLTDVLKGERIILRLPEVDDSQEMFELLQDDDILRYVNFTKPKSVEDCVEFIDYSLNEFAKGTEANYVIVNQGGKLLGVASLMRIDWENSNAELGIWLGKSFWGKGYNYEALNLLIDYAFNDLDFQYLIASVKTGNVRSFRTVQNLGFGYVTSATYPVSESEVESYYHLKLVSAERAT